MTIGAMPTRGQIGMDAGGRKGTVCRISETADQQVVQACVERKQL